MNSNKLLKNILLEETLSSLFYKANKILILNPNKNNAGKDDYKPISLRNIDEKIVNKHYQTQANNLQEE